MLIHNHNRRNVWIIPMDDGIAEDPFCLVESPGIFDGQPIVELKQRETNYPKPGEISTKHDSPEAIRVVYNPTDCRPV